MSHLWINTASRLEGQTIFNNINETWKHQQLLSHTLRSCRKLKSALSSQVNLIGNRLLQTTVSPGRLIVSLPGVRLRLLTRYILCSPAQFKPTYCTSRWLLQPPMQHDSTEMLAAGDLLIIYSLEMRELQLHIVILLSRVSL